jgi:hypothetical protein
MFQNPLTNRIAEFLTSVGIEVAPYPNLLKWVRD